MNGSGTPSDPYLVATPEDFDNVRNDLNAYYKQVNDIDMEEWGEFFPIGKGSSSFGGEYDGNGYSIKNIKITELTREGGIAIFSSLYSRKSEDLPPATIKNLTIDNATVSDGNLGSGASYNRELGILAGSRNHSIISNCHIVNCNLYIHNTIFSYGRPSAFGDGHDSSIVNSFVYFTNYHVLNTDTIGTTKVSLFSSGNSDVSNCGVEWSRVYLKGNNSLVMISGFGNDDHVDDVYDLDFSTENCYTKFQVVDESGTGNINTSSSGFLITNFNFRNSFGSSTTWYNKRLKATNCYSVFDVVRFEEEEPSDITITPFEGRRSTNSERRATLSRCYYQEHENIAGGSDFTTEELEGKSPLEMGQESTYVNWDFVDTWELGIGDRFPSIIGMADFPDRGGGLYFEVQIDGTSYTKNEDGTFTVDIDFRASPTSYVDSIRVYRDGVEVGEFPPEYSGVFQDTVEEAGEYTYRFAVVTVSGYESRGVTTTVLILHDDTPPGEVQVLNYELFEVIDERYARVIVTIQTPDVEDLEGINVYNSNGGIAYTGPVSVNRINQFIMVLDLLEVDPLTPETYTITTVDSSENESEGVEFTVTLAESTPQNVEFKELELIKYTSGTAQVRIVVIANPNYFTEFNISRLDIYFDNQFIRSHPARTGVTSFTINFPAPELTEYVVRIVTVDAFGLESDGIEFTLDLTDPFPADGFMRLVEDNRIFNARVVYLENADGMPNPYARVIADNKVCIFKLKEINEVDNPNDYKLRIIAKNGIYLLEAEEAT